MTAAHALTVVVVLLLLTAVEISESEGILAVMSFINCYIAAAAVVGGGARGESEGMNASPTSANCSSHRSTNARHD